MTTKKQKVDAYVNEWVAGKIKSGIKYRKEYSSCDRWKDYRKMYRGQWAEEIRPVNKIFSHGRSLVPRVYFRSPRVSITATRPDLVWHAMVVEAIDNQLIRETLLKNTLKRSVLDAYLCGTGPIKVGYDSEYGYIPQQAVGEGGETATQIGTKEGERIEYKMGIQPGMPWALRVLPEDIVIPWGAGDPSSLPWYAHYILRPLDDVKEDQKYDKEKTKDLKGTRSPDKGGGDKPAFKPREPKDKDVVFAELWEVHDQKTRQMMTFCEDKMILSTDDILQIEGLQIEFLQFNPDPEYFWAIPDCVIIEPQQLELNEVRTQASRHRAIALLKFIYKRGAFKDTDLEKLFSAEVGPGVPCDEETIAQAVTLLQPHIPPELWQEAQMILNDMKEGIGLAENQGAMYKAGTPPTAREAGIVEQAFDVRVDERKDIVADVLVNIIRKWNQYIFSFWTEEKVVKIVSPQGTPYWITYTGDELKGEYYLQVDPESGMPLNRQLKYMMAKDLYSTLGGNKLVDQILLLQILIQHYQSVEPLAAGLISSPASMDPRQVAAERQPFPMMGGAGGRGMSPGKPMPFDEARSRMK